MIANALAKYQAVQIHTSSPGELLIQLFDGLFKFLLVAREGLKNKKRLQANEGISRAYGIVSELLVSLDYNYAPELCTNLASLYDFSLNRITQANRTNDPALLDEVMKVLTPIREAFTIAVRQVNAASGPAHAQGATVSR